MLDCSLFIMFLIFFKGYQFNNDKKILKFSFPNYKDHFDNLLIIYNVDDIVTKV